MTIVPIEREGPVRTVRLNRPEKRNALNREMLGALLAAFRSEPDRTERLTVLRAEGPVFCAGMDLRERAGTLDTESPIEAVLDAVQHYPLPVVAVVHGDAIAGGNELALHCDLVVAAESARFGMSLAQIGLVPTWFLAKKIVETGGPVAAREMLLLGDPLPAARIHALGMIHKVVPDAGLEAAVEAVTARLTANAPLAMRAMKAIVLRQMAFRDATPHEDLLGMLRAARLSRDAREGIAARLEKRPANFTGE